MSELWKALDDAAKKLSDVRRAMHGLYIPRAGENEQFETQERNFWGGMGHYGESDEGGLCSARAICEF